MSFEGSLTEYTFLDVVAFLANRKESGILHIDFKCGEGFFSFSNGELVAARIGALTGFSAVNVAISMEGSCFRFDSQAEISPQHFSDDSQRLLLDRLLGTRSAVFAAPDLGKTIESPSSMVAPAELETAEPTPITTTWPNESEPSPEPVAFSEPTNSSNNIDLPAQLPPQPVPPQPATISPLYTVLRNMASKASSIQLFGNSPDNFDRPSQSRPQPATNSLSSEPSLEPVAFSEPTNSPDNIDRPSQLPPQPATISPSYNVLRNMTSKAASLLLGNSRDNFDLSSRSQQPQPATIPLQYAEPRNITLTAASILLFGIVAAAGIAAFRSRTNAPAIQPTLPEASTQVDPVSETSHLRQIENKPVSPSANSSKQPVPKTDIQPVSKADTKPVSKPDIEESKPARSSKDLDSSEARSKITAAPTPRESVKEKPAEEVVAAPRQGFKEISVVIKMEDGHVAEAYIKNPRPGDEAYESAALRLARQRRYPKDTTATKTIVFRVTSEP